MVVFVIDAEESALRQALALAQSSDAPVGPNPRVGAVIIDNSGRVVGSGYHRGAGTPHAEVVAIEQAGPAAKGATIVVTLEPCDHVGRTGPCTQAIINAGISKVVFAMSDPNPVSGHGMQRLRSAGIEVMGDVAPAQATALNLEWITAVSRGRPWVTVKLAMSKDNIVSPPAGGWFTSEEARRDVHVLRSRHQAVIVSTGTVLADDPSLTVREIAVNEQPLRVVVGQRDIPAAARVRDDSAALLTLKMHDPYAVLSALWDRGINRVMVESGPTMGRAWLAADVVDEVVLYLAPAVFSHGPVGFVEGDLADFVLSQSAQVGPDVRLRLLRRQG